MKKKTKIEKVKKDNKLTQHIYILDDEVDQPKKELDFEAKLYGLDVPTQDMSLDIDLILNREDKSRLIQQPQKRDLQKATDLARNPKTNSEKKEFLNGTNNAITTNNDGGSDDDFQDTGGDGDEDVDEINVEHEDEKDEQKGRKKLVRSAKNCGELECKMQDQSFSLTDLKFSPYTIAYSEIEHSTPPSLIESGSYGNVYRAHWLKIPVAVKVFKNQTFAPKQEKRFWREVAIHSSIQHPNVVQLLGVNEKKPHRCLVLEWMQFNLADAIARHEHSVLRPKITPIAIDIARGLLRLHSNKPNPIIHRDLKPENILIGKNWEAKIADLGLSRLMQGSGVERSMSVCGTLRYKAPELFSKPLPNAPKGTASYSPMIDVYSYGLILWELFSRKKPYEELLDHAPSIKSKKKKGVLPDIDKRTPPHFSELIVECLDCDPKQRPHLIQILSKLCSFPKLN